MESLVVPGVDDGWATVLLSGTFKSPIPVCTVVYVGADLLPAVVRMKDGEPQSFQIRLQNPTGDALQALDVHCVVEDQGSWEMSDGRKVDANKYMSTITDRQIFIGEKKTCLTTIHSGPYFGAVV
jgi:hypothetical protein